MVVCLVINSLKIRDLINLFSYVIDRNLVWKNIEDTKVAVIKNHNLIDRVNVNENKIGVSVVTI